MPGGRRGRRQAVSGPETQVRRAEGESKRERSGIRAVAVSAHQPGAMYLGSVAGVSVRTGTGSYTGGHGGEESMAYGRAAQAADPAAAVCGQWTQLLAS